MRSVSVALFLMSISICCFGQHFTRTIFWQVTRKDNQDTSYLFGTFHEVNPSFFETYPRAIQKLKQTSTLFVEEEMLSITAGKTQNDIKQQAFSEAKWNKLLNVNQKKIFKQFTDKAEDKSYYKRQPLSAMLALTRAYLIGLCDTTYRDPTIVIMDAFIERTAMLAGKSIQYLDDDQAKFIAKKSTEASKQEKNAEVSSCIGLMKYMLENDLSGCAVMDSYKNLQIDYAFGKHNMGKTDLASTRNKLWLIKLNSAFKTRSCFVAVGFKHLIHQEGLIMGLRRLGYSVEPVLR